MRFRQPLVRGPRGQNAGPRPARNQCQRPLARYWKPVYWCLRRKGFSNDGTKDLTRSGSCLGPRPDSASRSGERPVSDLPADGAGPLCDERLRRKETAGRRLPASGLISLDVDDLPEVPATESENSPEHAFCYAWATSILDQVLAELQDEYCGTGRSEYWEVFRKSSLCLSLKRATARRYPASVGPELRPRRRPRI